MEQRLNKKGPYNQPLTPEEKHERIMEILRQANVELQNVDPRLAHALHRFSQYAYIDYLLLKSHRSSFAVMSRAAMLKAQHSDRVTADFEALMKRRDLSAFQGLPAFVELFLDVVMTDCFDSLSDPFSIAELYMLSQQYNRRVRALLKRVSR